MSRRITFLLSIVLLTQSVGAFQNAAAGSDAFSPAERSRLQRESKIDGRVKVYDAASQRLLKSVTAKVRENDLGGLKTALSDWSRVLTEALKDVEASVKPGKKPKPLMRFEIQLRKAIAEIEGFKTTSGVEVFDLLNAWITQAEETRSRFVDILFQR